MRLPFDFELQSLPKSNISWQNFPFSYTGMKITMKRKILGDLLVGYYYPTAAFALLSMISFLINPDVVSTILEKVNIRNPKNQFFILKRFLAEWE